MKVDFVGVLIVVATDRRSMSHRIAVLRLDTLDGVTTAHLEDV